MSLPDPVSKASRRTRHVAALLLLVVALGGLTAYAGPDFLRARASASVPEGVVQLMDGHHQYTYHLVTGTEGLFDLKTDPKALRNLVREDPDLAARLRARLLSDMGVSSLEDLRGGQRDTIERLKALGYL